MKTNKERALEVNPHVKSHCDIYTYFWQIRTADDRAITDWYMFEDDAWKEITEHYSI